MKINIWIPRENVFSLNAWLKTPNIAEQVGWITNTTIDNYDESQLQMLFRD